MATLKDYIPEGVKSALLVALSLLCLCVFVGSFRSALKTGVARRLPTTPEYSRSSDPGMFWILVVFYAVGSIIFAGVLVASILRLVT